MNFIIQALITLWLIVAPGWGLLHAWRGVRRSSLRHTLLWFAAASTAWIVAWLANVTGHADRPWTYLALCMTACAGIAIFGARRPGVAAWNFVVGGLLLIMLLPLAEQPWDAADWQLDGLRAGFLAVLLLAILVNYLPAGPGAWWVPAWVAVGLTLWWLWRPHDAETYVPALARGVGAALTGGLLALTYRTWFPSPDETSTCSKRWLCFRRRYGLIWALRVQEQFNSAARNQGLPVRLDWSGMSDLPQRSVVAAQAEWLLECILRRFEAKWEL